jgi:hypothetical protein
MQQAQSSSQTGPPWKSQQNSQTTKPRQTRAAANSYNLQLNGGQVAASNTQEPRGASHANTVPNKTAGYVDMIHRMQSDSNNNNKMIEK